MVALRPTRAINFRFGNCSINLRSNVTRSRIATITLARGQTASAFLEGFNFRRFLEDCYSENSRRMSAFEPELLRPSFLPQLAETALKALRLWSSRTKPQPDSAM